MSSLWVYPGGTRSRWACEARRAAAPVQSRDITSFRRLRSSSTRLRASG
ncbi:hypothetical protein [Lysobacter gummosus]